MSNISSSEPARSSVPPSTVRRRAAAVALIGAAVAGVLQAATQPVGSDGTSAQTVAAMVAHPGQSSLASVFDLLNWVLLIPGVVATWGYLRNRGRIGGAVGTVLSSLGAIAVAFGVGGQQVQLRIAEVDSAAAVRVGDTLGTAPLFPGFLLCVYLGLIGVLVASIAAVRGRLVGWWVPVILIVGLLANLLLDNDLYGLPAAALYVLPGVADVLLAVGLFRAGSTVSPIGVARRTGHAETAGAPEAARA